MAALSFFRIFTFWLLITKGCATDDTIVKIASPGDTVIFGEHSINNMPIEEIKLTKNGVDIFAAYQKIEVEKMDNIVYNIMYVVEQYYVPNVFDRLGLVNKSDTLKKTPIFLNNITYTDAGIFAYQTYDTMWSHLTYELKVVDRAVIPTPDTTVVHTTVPKIHTMSSEQYTIIVVSTVLLITGLIIIVGTLVLYIVMFKKTWFNMHEKTHLNQTA